MMAPVTPHIAEELWAEYGKPYSIHTQPWPKVDEAATREDRRAYHGRPLPTETRAQATEDEPAEEYLLRHRSDDGDGEEQGPGRGQPLQDRSRIATHM